MLITITNEITGLLLAAPLTTEMSAQSCLVNRNSSLFKAHHQETYTSGRTKQDIQDLFDTFIDFTKRFSKNCRLYTEFHTCALDLPRLLSVQDVTDSQIKIYMIWLKVADSNFFLRILC